jgi:hypothetical protein
MPVEQPKAAPCVCLAPVTTKDQIIVIAKRGTNRTWALSTAVRNYGDIFPRASQAAAAPTRDRAVPEGLYGFQPSRRSLLYISSYFLSPSSNDFTGVVETTAIRPRENLGPAMLTRAKPRFRFGAVLVAEVRLKLKGQRWWYIIAAGLTVALGAVVSREGP